jgi:vancomycin resistance protein YoaR
VEKYIDRLANQLNRPAKNAELAFSGGRVVVTTASQSGFQINRESLSKKLTELIDRRQSIIEIETKQNLPEIHEGNIKKLGIKKLIGKGESAFYGSSDKRVHNIRTGAQKISGSLVAPGEIFSTADALGPVNRSTGYLQELVIKGDETVPEYGGGLCQIATTMFRAALQSGMEIVERHNHAYRVGYYEPPIGMDATIYIPSPDFKFKNNTSNWILIQYTLSGYQLSFDFYGTDDNREIYISQPQIRNIKPPPPAQEIKDPSLQPGQRIKEESAHPGADASFVYRVTRNGETLINQRIASHYQAWPAKYRVGPKKKDQAKKDQAKKKKD